MGHKGMMLSFGAGSSIKPSSWLLSKGPHQVKPQDTAHALGSVWSNPDALLARAVQTSSLRCTSQESWTSVVFIQRQTHTPLKFKHSPTTPIKAEESPFGIRPFFGFHVAGPKVERGKAAVAIYALNS